MVGIIGMPQQLIIGIALQVIITGMPLLVMVMSMVHISLIMSIVVPSPGVIVHFIPLGVISQLM